MKYDFTFKLKKQNTKAMYEILKNLPVPEKNAGFKKGKRSNKYPFNDMEIGDCMAFTAEGPKDPIFKKIYGSAMSYARRVKQGYTFRFGKIEENKYGCWKVASEKESLTSASQASGINPSKQRQRQSTLHITKAMLMTALENEGTLSGASRILNVSSRTISRLKQKFELE